MAQDIIEKIANYLENELEELKRFRSKEDNPALSEEIKSRTEVINFFKRVEGICNALSVLWAFAKLSGDKSGNEETKDLSHQKDDLSFFEYVQNLLNSDRNDFDDHEKQDIERFISHILFFQKDNALLLNDIESSLQLETSLETTSQNQPDKSFVLEAQIMTLTMLKRSLKHLIKPEQMIFYQLHSSHRYGHMVAIYQNSNDQQIYFFDPNHQVEQTADDLEHLALLIWDCFDHNDVHKAYSKKELTEQLRKISVDIYNFDELSPYDELDKTLFITTLADLESLEFIEALEEDEFFMQLIQDIPLKEKLNSSFALFQENKLSDTLGLIYNKLDKQDMELTTEFEQLERSSTTKYSKLMYNSIIFDLTEKSIDQAALFITIMIDKHNIIPSEYILTGLANIELIDKLRTKYGGENYNIKVSDVLASAKVAIETNIERKNQKL